MADKRLFTVTTDDEAQILKEFFRRVTASMKLQGVATAKLCFPTDENIPDIRISFIDEGQNG